MSRRRATPYGAGQRRRLRRTEEYVRNGKPFRLSSVGIVDHRLIAYVEIGDELVEMPYNDLESWVAESDAKDDEDAEPLPYDARTHCLMRMFSPQDRLFVAMAIEHMCQVEHGDKYGSFTEARPGFRDLPGYDEKYDPEKVPSRVERMQSKADELTKDWGKGWSFSQLYLKMRHVLWGGERGLSVLFDARTHATLKVFTQIKDKRVWAALKEVTALHTAPGVGSIAWTMRDADFLAALERHGVDPESISGKLRLDLLDHAAAGKYLDDTGSTRQSKKVRPRRPFGHQDVLRPGQVVEIDSTPVNAFCRTPAGEPIAAEVLVAIDVCTRMILALRVVPAGVVSGNVKLLLFDLLSGAFRKRWRLRDKSEWTCVPAGLALPEGMRPIIDGVKLDRGPQMDSIETWTSLAQRGVDVNQTPTCTGTAKGFVEAVQVNWALVTAGTPGDKGASPKDRGDQTGAALGPTIEQFELMLREWVLRAYHDRKHRGVHDPLDPRRSVSPMECFINHNSPWDEISVPIDENFVADFLHHATARATFDGMRVGKHIYQGKELNGMRDEERGTRCPPLEVRYDPYFPDRVLVRRPEDKKYRSVGLKAAYNDEQTVGQAFIEADLRERRAAGERTDFTATRTQSLLETGRVRHEHRQLVTEANEELERQRRATGRRNRRERVAAEERRRLAAKDPALAGVLHGVGDDADVVDLTAARARKNPQPESAVARPDVRTFSFEDIP